ncbi:MAG TPA: hypothetical protein VK191_05360, partial [Symbiobacteriaceae bacterium]|nr:hypothetical protein [Symbiobacteriaceae bacterium]
MRRRRALIGLLSLLLVLSGCWDMRELEEANYVIALGVDKGKKERLSVTFVLAGPHQVAASSEEGETKGGNRITVEAPTIAGANAYLNTVVPRPTSLAQTKLIMISEELVRSEGMVILDESSRSRNLRRSTMIVVTKQPVSKILDSLPPGPEGLNDFAFLQTSAEARRSGFLPVRTSLNDFLIRASTAYQEPVAYYAALVEPKPKEESGKPEEGAGKQAGGSAKQEGGSAKPESQRRLVPGISRRKGGPAVDFFGAAAFRQTKMVGALDAQDTRA